jgi:hypothetical protein
MEVIMKDEFGEYIEIYEVIGAYKDCVHQTVVARATNEETFKKILKTVSRLKHQDDRSHRIYRAYSEKMREKYCREMLGISSEEFSEMISKQFEADNNYYQGDSELLNHEKKIDEALGAKLDEMMDKHPGIFKTWYAENGFDYKHFDCFFPRVSKAYITFGDKE